MCRTPLDGSFDSFSPEDRKEFWAALALKYTKGLGARSCARLLQKFGSACLALDNLERWAELGINRKCVRFFENSEWREPALQEWRNARNSRGILLWTNPCYPELLKNTAEAPLFLYYSGDLDLLANPGVGVVGARNCSFYSLDISASISRQLSASGITVISGLARGVDCKAHEAALQSVGSTIAVLGCGLDVFYPPENKALQERIASEGLLLSEYPAGTTPESYYFPIRNRIISGLSLGVLIVEATAKSGSLITANLALDYNREVYAVPGRFASNRSLGCHDLIRRGAKPVFDVDDILLDLAPRLKKFLQQRKAVAEGADPGNPLGEKGEIYNTALADKEFLGKAEADFGMPAESEASSPEGKSFKETEELQIRDLEDKILNLLRKEGPLQADSICTLLDIQPSFLSSQLLLMELSGRVKRYPGMVYSVD